MVLCVTIVRSLAAVWLAGLLSPAAEDMPPERKARSLTDLNCGINQRLYIKEAYFSQQQSSDPPCTADCTPANPPDPSSLSFKEDNNGSCRNRFSLHDLSTIYEAVDEGNSEALKSLDASFSGRGNYVICYFCQSRNNYWQFQYLSSRQELEGWTRVDSSYFYEDDGSLKLSNLSLKLHLADTSVISRFWLYFDGAEFTIKCTEEGEVQTTISPEVTTISTGDGDTEFTINYAEEGRETTTSPADTTGGGDARFTSYLLPAGIILAFIVICIGCIFIFRRIGPKGGAVSRGKTKTISVSVDRVPPSAPSSDYINMPQTKPPPHLGNQQSDYEEVL